MPYGISVSCHPAEVRIPPLPPSEVSIRFSDLGGMQGWVDLLRENGLAGNWTRRPVSYNSSTLQQRHHALLIVCFWIICQYSALHWYL